MKITVCAWFNEVDYYFKISHKILHRIWEILETDLLATQKLDVLQPEHEIQLVLTTGEESLHTLYVGGPFRKRKRNQFMLWLPYLPITQAQDINAEFVFWYFEALKKVFAFYKIDSQLLEPLKEKILHEVVNNPEYVYEEEFS